MIYHLSVGYCPTVTVTRTREEGKYFYADDDELTAFFGYDNWNGKVTEVVKAGEYEASTFREIIVWKVSDGSHGRRNPSNDASVDDWNDGDVFISKECSLGNHENNVKYQNRPNKIVPNLWHFFII